MKLTILGSGTAIIRKERKAASFLLELNDKLLLFDCGWGAAVNLLESGNDIQKLDHILISHPHADHIGNLMNMMQSMLVSSYFYPHTKRSKTIYLHGYQGFKRDYEALRSIMFPERVELYKIEVYEYLNTKRNIDNLLIQAKEVRHVQEYFHSVAYRVQSKEEAFAYSGDCGYDKNLVELAKDTDLAVFEMSISPKMYKEHGPYPNHLSAYECGLIAKESNVKKLVIAHLYDNATKQEITKDIRENYKGSLIISRDLQVIKS